MNNCPCTSPSFDTHFHRGRHLAKMAPAAPGESHGVAYKDDMSFGWKPLQGGNGRLFSGILEGEQT